MSRVFTVLWLTVLSALFLACGPSTDDIPVVAKVDLSRYAGTWYEIARLPNSFERGLVCVTARYTLGPDGGIGVVNTGRRQEDRTQEKTARGNAWIPNPGEPGKLKVSFFFPFRADYRIIALDTLEYRWAMVTAGNRDYLWILSRTPVLQAGVYDRLVARAAARGFDTIRLILVPQDCPAPDKNKE